MNTEAALFWFFVVVVIGPLAVWAAVEFVRPVTRTRKDDA